MRGLWHRLKTGHWREPWVIDIETNELAGCRRCLRDRVMRAIAREPSRVPPVGFP